MKEIHLKNGRIIKTTWFRIDEAAAYCGLSRTAFTMHTKELPHGGNNRTRLYDEKILNAWIRNELDIPFASTESEKKDAKKNMIRYRRTPIKEDQLLVHPNTGKIYGPKKEDSHKAEA